MDGTTLCHGMILHRFSGRRATHRDANTMHVVHGGFIGARPYF
jgi:hypothetical protein